MQAAVAWFRSLHASRFGAPLEYFAATWTLVSVVRVHAPIHLDTARDLLIARDCVIGVGCGAGPRTSFGGWTQGALWSHVLELRELLGLGLGVLEEVSHFTLAAAAALVPLAARSLGRTPSALTWALWFPASLVTINYPTLWNPTLLPLALSCFCAAFFHAARTRGSVAFVAAAAALAISIGLHVVCALLVPVMLVATVACAARPIVAVTGAAAVMVGELAVSSPGAFAANWPLIAAQAPMVVLVLAAAVVAGATARRVLSARDGRARADAVARGLCIYFVCLVPLLAVMADHALRVRYLAPLVTPAAILLSTRAGDRQPPRAWARASGVVAVVGYIAFAIADSIFDPSFRVIEVERVADGVYGRGVSYGYLFRHLRGPDAVRLLGTLAALEPLDLRPPAADERDLLVLRVRQEELPPDVPADWTVVELDGSRVAVAIPYEPWVRLSPLEICRANEMPSCVILEVQALEQHEGMRWADRAYPSLLTKRRPARGQQVSYRLPLRPLPGDASRRVHLFADRCEGWRLTIGGVGDNDGRSVHVEADRAVGAVEFSVVAGPGCRWWLPPFVEVNEGDAALDLLTRTARERAR
jgi:hypothetical protein